MFPMTPLQSWAFLALLIVLAVLIVRLAHQIGSTTLDVLESEHSSPQVLTGVSTLRPERPDLRLVRSDQPVEDDSDPLAIWRDVLDS